MNLLARIFRHPKEHSAATPHHPVQSVGRAIGKASTRDFWRYCRTSGVVDPDAMTRAELENAYWAFCVKTEAEPLTSWHLNRELKSNGFEVFRLGHGKRQWLYRAVRRPHVVQPATPSPAPPDEVSAAA